jgi:hypothetical protein
MNALRKVQCSLRGGQTPLGVAQNGLDLFPGDALITDHSLTDYRLLITDYFSNNSVCP